VGIAYNIKPTSTVLRVSYARTLETPFNENLVLSSIGCSNAGAGAAAALHCGRCRERCSPASATSSTPACSRPSANTPWSAANTSGSTPTTPSTSACWATRPSPSPSTGTTRRFPATPARGHSSVPRLQRLHSLPLRWPRAFYPPQVAGAGATVGQTGLPFRIDHDEKFNQTTHVQYTLSRGRLVERPVGRLQLALRLGPGGTARQRR
jgi:hypothetical protein